MLTITKNAENTTLTLLLEGRLDTTTSPQLEEAIADSLDSVSLLVLDFEKLEYISSSGLRVLLSAQKKIKPHGEMKVIRINEIIKEIFEMTGFDSVLTVE